MAELVDRAVAHRAAVEVAKRDIRDNGSLIAKKVQELGTLQDLNATTRFAYTYLDELVKEESGRFIKRLTEILDYGVKTIFDDCEYSVEIRVSEGGRATIHLLYVDEEGNALSPDIQVCGGGIRTCIGLMMQIFFLYHYRCYPLLVIDEGLSQVSSAYLPNVFGLLQEMAESNGLKVLLVTHDERMLEYATKRYEIASGSAVEVGHGSHIVSA